MSALLHWADAFKAIRTRINAKGVVGALKNMVLEQKADNPTVGSEADATLGTAFSLPVTKDGLPLSPRSHKLAIRRQSSQPAPSMLQYGASGDKAGYTGASGTIANAVATLKLQLSARKLAAAELGSDAKDGDPASGPSCSIEAIAAEDVSDSERVSGNSLSTGGARGLSFSLPHADLNSTPPPLPATTLPAAGSDTAVGNDTTGESAPAADIGRSVFNPQATARRSSLTFHVNAAVGGGPAPSNGSHSSTCSNLCTSPRTLSWTLPTGPDTHPVHTASTTPRIRGGRESRTPGSPTLNPDGLSDPHLNSKPALQAHTVERSVASVPGLGRKGGLRGSTQTGSPTGAAAAAVRAVQQRRRRHSVLFPGGSVPVHDSSSVWSAIIASGMLPSAEGRPSFPAALTAAISDQAHSTMTLQRVHTIAASATASTDACLAPATPAEAAPSASTRQPVGEDAEAVSTTEGLAQTMMNAQPGTSHDTSSTVTTTLPVQKATSSSPAVPRIIPRARLAVSTANSPVKAKPAQLPHSRSADGASPAADGAAPTPTAQHAPPLRSAMRAVASEFGERDRRSPSIHRSVSYKAAAGLCITAVGPPHSTTAAQPSGGETCSDPHSLDPPDEDLLFLAMPPFALNPCPPTSVPRSAPAPPISPAHAQHGSSLGRSTAAKGMVGNTSSVQESEAASTLPMLASSTSLRHSPPPLPPTPAPVPATERSSQGPTIEVSHDLISPFGAGLACLLLGPEPSASSDPSRRFGHTRASPSRDTSPNLASAFLCPGLAASLLEGRGPSAGERLTLPSGVTPSKPKAPLPPHQASPPPLLPVMLPVMSPALNLIPSPFCSPSLASMLLGAHGTASAGAAS